MTLVAIDGPAGSGKSTVARAVGVALGVPVLDTGAMYRAVTFGVLRAGVEPDDDEAVAEVARRLDLRFGDQVLVDGDDATQAIRAPDVTACVSRVSANPEVRRLMVERQRAWVGARTGAVVEGRDIGTVVLPDAPVKVFLTASPEVRARRRQADEEAAARAVEVGAVAADIERRDRYDSSRATSPLRPADDAVVLDTSEQGVSDVVARILELVDESVGR